MTKPFSFHLDQVLADIEKARLHPGQLPGISTGIRGLDNTIDGLQDTHLIVLGGRPAMGKTAFAVGMAVSIAKTKSVGFLSLEQPAKELAFRVVADGADIALTDLKRGNIDQTQMNVILDVHSALKMRQIFLEDSFDRHLDNIRLEATKLYDNHGIEILFLDYLQLATAKDVRTRDREVAQISAGLKELANVLEIPVVVLSQLNRESEKSNDKRPTMGHLRESGSIEQDADIVGLLYREHYYFLQQKKPSAMDTEAYQDWQKKLSDCHGKAEIIVTKNRHGPTGTVPLAFDDTRMRFSDLAPEMEAGHV